MAHAPFYHDIWLFICNDKSQSRLEIPPYDSGQTQEIRYSLRCIHLYNVHYQAIAGGGSKHITYSLESFLRGFITPFNGPLQEMWFVMVIMIFFLGLPLYRRILSSKIAWVICLCISLAFYFMPFEWTTDILCIDRAFHYFIFFFVGILIWKLDSRKWMKKRWVPISMALFYAIGTVIGSELLMALAGCFFFWCMAHLAEPKFENLFSSFRNYTYQIFLMGIFFQLFVKVLYLHIGLANLYLTFFIICIIVGLYLPVLCTKGWKKFSHPLLHPIIGI